jgi:tape measure domain-containing protein
MALDAMELAIILKAHDEASSVIRQVEGATHGLNSAFASVGQTALGVAAGIASLNVAGSALRALGGVVVGFNSTLEQSAVSWKTFTGSAQAAQAVMTQIQTIAATTPFEFEDVDKAAKRFVNAGFSAQGALNFIQPLSNAVASVGLGAAGVDRVSLALAQMTQKGKVSGEEMLQLTEAQIPAWEILAQATGKPIPELQKLVQQGKITAQAYTDAFASFYSEGGKFANASKDQSLTFAGSMSTIRDQLNIVGSTAFQPLFKVLSDLARSFATFVQSDAFTVWGARVQAVVGLVVEGIQGLYGAFASSLGGIFQVVSSVGQAIYGALQWINPFASHSEPLVSQVQNGVDAIKDAYGSLSTVSGTFDTVRGAFESLSGVTENFSREFGDDMPTKVEKALAIMGPGAAEAFHTASDAIDDATISVGAIKSQWDTATAALVPLQDALDNAKDALKDQQNTLEGLRSNLSDAKAAYDPLTEQLKAVQQNAKDAEQAIKDLTSAPVEGTAEFERKISEGNIALKEQELALSRLKHGDTYAAIGAQVDQATAKLKEMQRAQTLQAGPSSDSARAAIVAQQREIDVLKDKQQSLLDPAQKELDKRRDLLDTLRLEKDATIGVAQERIKAAAADATGIKEQTERQIADAITAAKNARDAALSQEATLSPQVKAQQDAIKGIETAIRNQEKAVSDAQRTTDAANNTYSAAKDQVDELGSAYRSGKSEIAGYEQQLKQLIQTGDLQVQKAAEAKKAADQLAKSGAATGGGAGSPRGDVLAGLDIEGSQKKIKAFTDQVAATRQQVTGHLDALGNKWNDIWASVANVLDNVLARFSGFAAVAPATEFLRQFATIAAGVGAALVVAAPLIGLFAAALAPVAAVVAAALTPMGLLLTGIVALAAAWSLNTGSIQEKAAGLLAAFEPLRELPAIIDKAIGGDVVGALGDFIGALSDVRAGLIETLAGWGAAFIDWLLPQLPALMTQLTTFGAAIIGWILAQGDTYLANLLKWGSAFVDWIAPRIPVILAALSGLGLQILNWVRAQGLLIADRLGEWAAKFIEWIIPLLPLIGTALTQIAGAVIDFVAKAVPIILGALADWAGAFLGWVGPLIPDLLGALFDLVGKLTTWVVEVGLPKIVDVLLKWGAAFIDWVAPRIEPMLDETGKLLDRLGKWILDQIPVIEGKIGQWGNAFINWVATVVAPALGPALDKLINGGDGFVGIIPWIKAQAEALPENLAYWVTKFLIWTAEVVKGLPAALADIAKGIADWVQSDGVKSAVDAAKPLGTALLDGLQGGVLDALLHFPEWITRQIIGTIPSIQEGIRKALQSQFGGGSGSGGGSGGFAPEAVTPGQSSDTLTNPIENLNQRGGPIVPAGAAAITDAQFSAAVRAMGFTEAEIESICGPIAAEGVARALGHAVDLKELARGAEAAGLGNFRGDVGTFGNAGEIGILKRAGVDAQTVSQAEAEALAAQGIPIIINTAKHFWAAQGYDPATGKFDVGATNVFKAGGGRNLSLSQISGLGGAVQGFIAPTGIKRAAAQAAEAPVLPPSSQSDMPFTNMLPKGAFDTAISGAQEFVNAFGITMDKAQQIMDDHGKTALRVFGTDVPADFRLTDTAVEDFAAAFGISWDQARSILETGGDTAKLVMGTTIPDAAQASLNAVGGLGNNALWAPIAANAAAAGKDLKTYLQDTGAASIDIARASLDDLVKASGLSLPEVQKQAGDAGRDMRAWLLTVGVPAAQELSKSLGTEGVAGAATGLKNPVDLATKAVSDLGGTQSNTAKDIATQISFVLQQLSDKMPTLIQGIKDFVTELGKIPTDVMVNIAVKSSGGGDGGGGGGGSSGGGGSNAASADLGDLSDQSVRADLRNQGYAVGQNSDGTYYAEKRAAGGPVRAGVPYFVGERGPELFTPQQSGTISPSNTGGIDYVRLAAAMVAALQTMPAPRVAVEDIRTSLIGVGQRNGGIVGLA